MQQLTKYWVESLGVDQVNVLSNKDANLIPSYEIKALPFYPTKYRVDLSFYDLNDYFIETIRDLKSYTVQGVVQKGKVNQIVLDPVQDALSYGFRGDTILRYSFYNNLFSSDNAEDITLYITDISTDRTEIRARCLDLTNSALKSYVDLVYSKLNLQSYFSEIYLEFVNDGEVSVGTNIMTEVIDGILHVTFKLYEPLPDTVDVKSRFTVLERVGDTVGFKVHREVELVEEKKPTLKGPNFNISMEEQVTSTTDYLNFDQLFSEPVSKSKTNLERILENETCTVGVNYEDFKDFIHFSSAVERLLNFRYKMNLIDTYQTTLDNLPETSSDRNNYRKQIDGIISNFDGYERYLYFEKGPKAWPKIGNRKPYVNVSETDLDPEWWNSILQEAEQYDDQNKDALICTIPMALRDNPENEPLVIFVHMLGQHFDSQWIYAKALADKYKADNRLTFGISKDLVREAIRDLGINLYESGQNLTELFDFTENVQDIIQVPDTAGNQPVSKEQYLKEIYKRIYHNLPLLIKAKGTQRGLRALINCFGIPDDILTIDVRGGVEIGSGVYFGPAESVSSSIDKVRIGKLVGSKISSVDQYQDGTKVVQDYEIPFKYVVGGGSGSTLYVPVLSEYVNTVRAQKHFTDDQHQVFVGFEINKQSDQYFKNCLSSSGKFNYDDIVGDPRNHKEQYGNAFDIIRRDLPKVPFRTPAAIVWLARYFDTMLFRSIKEFLPARSNVSVGVIVEDSILHRNRYSGTRLSSTFQDKVRIVTSSGTYNSSQIGMQLPVQSAPETTPVGVEVKDLNVDLNIMGITGSDGGYSLQDLPVSGASTTASFTVNGREVVVQGTLPVHYAPWTTGDFTGSKAVFDNSPSYNGELSGSYIQSPSVHPTLNPYLRGGANTHLYSVGAIFGNLPSPLLCDLVWTPKSAGKVHSYFESREPNRYRFVREFLVPVTGTFMGIESKSVEDGRDLPDQMYIGWTESNPVNIFSGAEEFDYGILKGTKRGLELPYSHPYEYQTVHFREGIRNHNRVRIQLFGLFDFGQNARYYYDSSGLVFTYCFESASSELVMCSYAIKVEYVGGESETFYINPVDFNSNASGDGSRYGIIPVVGANTRNQVIDKYGIVSIGTDMKHADNLTLQGKEVFVDADWFYSWGNGWERDNERDWTIEWSQEDKGFLWKWKKGE